MNEQQSRTDFGWQLTREHGKIGTGNWEAFPKDRLPEIFDSAAQWKAKLAGVERPWLCWCVDEEWCYLQQQLVAAVGWTPVVGTDGQNPSPRLTKESVFIDFNAQLRLPAMWMHFPLDFVHHFCGRLAYWHSDVLPPVSIVRRLAEQYETIEDGEIIGIPKPGGPLQWLNRLKKGKKPFYKSWTETAGCTTAGASRSLWESGVGWWRNPQKHPNASPLVVKKDPHWEHGVGIWFWEKYFGGRLRPLCVKVEPWHYCPRHKGYIRRRDQNKKILDSKQEELRRSFDLKQIAETLELNCASAMNSGLTANSSR
jgi:hypothetical protein